MTEVDDDCQGVDSVKGGEIGEIRRGDDCDDCTAVVDEALTVSRSANFCALRDNGDIRFVIEEKPHFSLRQTTMEYCMRNPEEAGFNGVAFNNESPEATKARIQVAIDFDALPRSEKQAIVEDVLYAKLEFWKEVEAQRGEMVARISRKDGRRFPALLEVFGFNDPEIFKGRMEGGVS